MPLKGKTFNAFPSVPPFLQALVSLINCPQIHPPTSHSNIPQNKEMTHPFTPFTAVPLHRAWIGH